MISGGEDDNAARLVAMGSAARRGPNRVGSMLRVVPAREQRIHTDGAFRRNTWGAFALMTFVRLDAFKQADGRIDWRAYNAAQVDAGEKCMTCGKFIFALWADVAGPQECHACKSLHGTPETDHESRIRCPRCHHIGSAFGPECSWAGNELFQDGTHRVECPECQFSFEIETHITYTFTSPAKLGTEKT